RRGQHRRSGARTAGFHGNVAATARPRGRGGEGAGESSAALCLRFGWRLIWTSVTRRRCRELLSRTRSRAGRWFRLDQIELMVVANARDIGGFGMRRALATAKLRLV